LLSFAKLKKPTYFQNGGLVLVLERLHPATAKLMEAKMSGKKRLVNEIAGRCARVVVGLILGLVVAETVLTGQSLAAAPGPFGLFGVQPLGLPHPAQFRSLFSNALSADPLRSYPLATT
jgi:hypothetical protein